VSTTPRKGRPPGRAAEILSTFTRYVADRGYDAANFSDIAGELGMSKGTIVHHFGTKDRLLAALHESYMRRRLAEAKLMIERLDSPTEQLAALLYAFVLYQVVDRDATVAFQREIVRLADHAVMAEGRALRGEYLRLVRDTLRAGVAAGELRACDVDVQSLLMFGSAQWAWTWFDPNGPVTAEHVGAALVDLVLGGLLTGHAALAGLVDVDGHLARTVHACIADAAEPAAEPQPAAP
jgi:Transcriptional regulator